MVGTKLLQHMLLIRNSVYNIEEGFIQKQRQRSSRLFGGPNNQFFQIDRGKIASVARN